MASPRTGGRKQDPPLGDGRYDEDRDAETRWIRCNDKGFECGNCGLKEREEEQMRENAGAPAA
jgi:hypothetical protein